MTNLELALRMLKIAKSQKRDLYDTLHRPLITAFSWTNTFEGFSFWRNQSLYINEVIGLFIYNTLKTSSFMDLELFMKVGDIMLDYLSYNEKYKV